MGNSAGDQLQVELALDVLEGELAAELPPHLRAFARAHAEGRPPPAAPLLARLASTLDTARAACRHDALADRGLALLRLVVPLVIEDDPAVTRWRAQPLTWPGLARLDTARDEAARARFGIGAIELFHRLHGVAGAAVSDASPGPAIEGWQQVDAPVDAAAIHDVWQAIAARLGVTGTVRIDRGPKARPRAFVVEPRVEVIVVLPDQIDTPAARFAVLHELGHAAAALVLGPGVPRVLDEAVAAYVARLAEPPSWLHPRWGSDLAAAARRQRTAIAAVLDRVERELPTLGDLPSPSPPWALWHDPGAQAAYLAAEDLAAALHRDLGPNPPRGQFARALAAERDRIDRRSPLAR